MLPLPMSSTHPPPPPPSGPSRQSCRIRPARSRGGGSRDGFLGGNNRFFYPVADAFCIFHNSRRWPPPPPPLGWPNNQMAPNVGSQEPLCVCNKNFSYAKWMIERRNRWNQMVGAGGRAAVSAPGGILFPVFISLFSAGPSPADCCA